jgi:hypothetical protein
MPKELEGDIFGSASALNERMSPIRDALRAIDRDGIPNSMIVAPHDLSGNRTAFSLLPRSETDQSALDTVLLQRTHEGIQNIEQYGGIRRRADVLVNHALLAYGRWLRERDTHAKQAIE